MENINLSDVVEAINGKVVSGSVVDQKISQVIIDSRVNTLNGLFVAIKGENNDGHTFIKQAIDNGAIATIISEEQTEYIEDVVYIKVEDTILGLKALALWYRTLFDIPVVAVTGSVGKTTTKDMIASVLRTKFNVLKTEGNFNSEIGAPLTILKLNHTHDIAVIEMGMDHLGQIESISSIVKPDVAVITNIGVAHIEYLKTRENILKAKCEVFKHLKENGVAVLNLDDDMLSTVDNDVRKIWFGINNKDANLFAHTISVDYTNGKVLAKLNLFSKEYDLKIPGLSEHLVYSALSAIAVGSVYNIEMKDMLLGILNYEHTKMRMDIHKLKNNILLIDDTYNANPDSMKSLIDTIVKSDKDNKFVILGDMFELGDETLKLHTEVLNYAACKNLSKILVTGNNMKKAVTNISCEQIEYYESKEALIDNLRKIMLPNSIIACKASRGMKFENITEKIIEIDTSL